MSRHHLTRIRERRKQPPPPAPAPELFPGQHLVDIGRAKGYRHSELKNHIARKEGEQGLKRLEAASRLTRRD